LTKSCCRLLARMTEGVRSYRLGFVGLGNMGSNMGRKISDYAHQKGMPTVRIRNRTKSKADELARHAHCQIAQSLQEITQTCGIVQTCLANAEKTGFDTNLFYDFICKSSFCPYSFSQSGQSDEEPQQNKGSPPPQGEQRQESPGRSL
jgi:NAD binding domain of 6-phosphogluconate dehydrogenase